MPSKLLVSILAALLLPGCALFREETQREKFIDLLKAFNATRPKPRPRPVSPEQKAIERRLQELRDADPEALDRLKAAVETVGDSRPETRRQALLALAAGGEAGELILRYRTLLFDPRNPGDFDSMLLKLDDPALLHLRRGTLRGDGASRALAARALDLYVPRKLDALWKWALVPGRKFERIHALEFLAARNRALPVLTPVLLYQGGEEASRALALLAEIGTEKAAAVIVDAASNRRRPGLEPEDFLRALTEMEAAAAGPALAELASSADASLRVRAAWALANRVLPGHRALLDPLCDADEGATRLAGWAGRLRFGHPGAVTEIETLAGSDDALTDPLPFLVFLQARPRLAREFPSLLATHARSRRDAVRERAAGLLAFPAGEESATALRDAALDAQPPVRAAALEAISRRLRREPHAGLLQALRALADDPLDDIRHAAWRALGEVRDAESTARLLDVLDSADDEDVDAALEALAFFRSPDILRRVPLRLYWGGDLRARCLLVKTMIMASDPGADTALRELIELPHRACIRFALPLVDPARAASVSAALRRALALSDPRVVAAAVILLAHAGDDTPPADPRPKLLSEDGEVRAAALRALAVRGRDLDAIRALSDSLDPVLRSASTRILASLPDPASAPRFRAGVFEGESSLRADCVRALQALGDPEALPFLLHASSDPCADVRIEAAHALAGRDEEAAAAALEGLLEDPDGRVRIAAAKGLGPPRGAESVEALRRAVEEDALGLGFRGRAQALGALGALEEAAGYLESSADLFAQAFEAPLAAARMHARAGAIDGVLETLRQARSWGFDAWYDLREDAAFSPLFENEDFTARMQALFSPEREGPGFLDRFRGRVKLHLTNGAHLDGVLRGFRDERFILELSTGVSEIPKGQASRLQFME